MKGKYFFIFLCLVLLISCKQEPMQQKASLVVKVQNEISGEEGVKTIMPKLDLMEVSRYSVEGVGPSGASFSPVYENGSEISVSELTPGEWTITARAYNADGKELAMGSTACVLTRGKNDVTVLLDTIPGTGTAQISFSWDDTISSCSTIKITTIFETDSGAQIKNEKEVNTVEKKAIITQSLAAGSYVVKVQVSDNTGSIGVGAAEALRIVDKTQSIGVIPLVSSGSAITVSIDNKVASPMQTYLEYTPKGVSLGERITLTVQFNNLPSYVSSSDLRYQWYRDGKLMKIGSSTYTIEAEKGVHRYDVIVTNTRKGSTSSASVTFNFQ